MGEVWKVGLGLSGLGAVGSFVLWSLYRKWLSLAIFQQMTREQQYSLFRLFFFLTFAFAVLTVAAYLLVNWLPERKQAARMQSSRDELVALLRHREQRFSGAADELCLELAEGNNPGERHYVEQFKRDVTALMDLRIHALREGNLVLAQEVGAELRQRELALRSRAAGYDPPPKTCERVLQNCLRPPDSVVLRKDQKPDGRTAVAFVPPELPGVIPQ